MWECRCALLGRRGGVFKMISQFLISTIIAQLDRGLFKVPAVWAGISKIRKHEGFPPSELQHSTQTERFISDPDSQGPAALEWSCGE